MLLGSVEIVGDIRDVRLHRRDDFAFLHAVAQAVDGQVLLQRVALRIIAQRVLQLRVRHVIVCIRQIGHLGRNQNVDGLVLRLVHGEMIHLRAILLDGDPRVVGGIAHDAAQSFRRVVDGRLHARGVVVGVQTVNHHPRAVADPTHHAVFHAVAQISLLRLVHKVVIVPARGYRSKVRFVAQVVVIHHRQLHPAPSREVYRVIADAQHLRHLGQVAVVVQVVLHHIQIDTVSV